MTTERAKLFVGDQLVEVVFKHIKNLHLSVHPPFGRVRVAAPDRLDADAVRLAVASRLGWIRRQQKRISDQERQSLREMVSGESHFYLGRRYRLDVQEGQRPDARLRRPGTIELVVQPSSSREDRERTLYDWYRTELRSLLPPVLDKWIPVVGVAPARLGIKRMRTRWGSCNPSAGRIWLNLELVKKKPLCLEFVLVHELLHLIEPKHNHRFTSLMDRAMPQWREHRAELNRAPLAHEDWRY